MVKMDTVIIFQMLSGRVYATKALGDTKEVQAEVSRAMKSEGFYKCYVKDYGNMFIYLHAVEAVRFIPA